ncbi:hypothetical protein [Flavobacterium polysaccharolyticum]|uniref:Uncharacterized protein n=1 Tax=Flavobacterium polysaccharolyticum TaxID=3133148 RepID=A0ABU9NJ77_9FLAO
MTKLFVISNGVRSKQVNVSNVLFVDVNSEDESKVSNEIELKTSLTNGIPIVINEPSANLLKNLTGFGVDGCEAAIIIKGKGNYFYTRTFMKANFDIEQVKTATMQIQEVRKDENEEERTSEPEVHSNLVSYEEINLVEAVLEGLKNIAEIESILDALGNSSWQNESVPQNRKWSNYWAMDSWKSMVLNDPSEETSKTQTARFRFTCTFSLLAANKPAKVKIFNVSVGGTGFEPMIAGQSLIRDNNKHRGWAQSLTSVEFLPTSNEFGNIESYLPINTAKEVTVSTGYSWDIGFSGGVSAEGPSGEVSFSYSENKSSSISNLDFETLTESEGDNGMRFYHNCHIVGGDTSVNPKEMFGSEWTKMMGKMFYYHFPDGDRVRSWPNLSKSLLKPGCECVWYAKSTASKTGVIKFGATQGLNYFYSKGGVNHNSHIKNTISNSIQIDMANVNYDDPR